MSMTPNFRRTRQNPRHAAIWTALPVALFLSGCVPAGGDFDWDMRSGSAGLDTTEAARQASAAPPRADARGVLSYPTYQVAVAQRGDTVATVASRIGLSPTELASHNALRPEDPLRPGEVLALPRRVAEPVATAAVIGTPAIAGAGVAPLDVSAIATTALDSGATAPAAKGPEPVRHKVTRGESAYTIARKYNVTVAALASWNGLGPDPMVREGQYLLIPTAVPGSAPVAPVAVVTEPGAGSPTPEPPSSSTPLPDEAPQRASEKAKDTPPSPNLDQNRSAASAAAFGMPVTGSIIRGYEKKKNDGIDISAAPGATVKAAADGTVAAVTKDTDGVPIMVVRHPDNLMTVYAGVAGMKVAKGDTVKRGQALGIVAPGTPPVLHFEIRKGLDSVDPMPYLQ
jgi:murein DD-endopeptidase MepM/ murein hydrolase activator NlpD